MGAVLESERLGGEKAACEGIAGRKHRRHIGHPHVLALAARPGVHQALEVEAVHAGVGEDLDDLDPALQRLPRLAVRDHGVVEVLDRGSVLRMRRQQDGARQEHGAECGAQTAEAGGDPAPAGVTGAAAVAIGVRGGHRASGAGAAASRASSALASVGGTGMACGGVAGVGMAAAWASIAASIVGSGRVCRPCM